MHHPAVSPPNSNLPPTGNAATGATPQQGPQDGSLEKLKEGKYDAQIRSQHKTRTKTKLDQSETLSASPPPLENGYAGPSGSGVGAGTRVGVGEVGMGAAGVGAGTGGVGGGAVKGAPLSRSTSIKKTFTPTSSKPKLEGLEGFMGSMPTSSYPFPQMSTPRGIGYTFSPSVGGPHDRALPSGSATPSSFAFLPPGTTPITPYESPDFPTPNMYELALRLHSEPGIDAFWSNLVKICTTCYKAERLSLALPTDSSDLENAHWGQKATYHMEENDALSLTYMGEGGVVGDQEMEETEGEESDGQTGVPIPEEYVGGKLQRTVEEEGTAGEDCEGYLSMDESPLPIESNPEQPFSPIVIGVDKHGDTSSNSDWVSEGEVPSPTDSPRSQNGPYEPTMNGINAVMDPEDQLKGRVFPILQSLSYEADALLDGAGVKRVLQRGKTVVLSREYRDIQAHFERSAPEKTQKEIAGDLRFTPWSTAQEATNQGMGAKRGSLHLSLKDLPPPTTPGRPPSEPPTPLTFVSKSQKRKGIGPRLKNEVQSQYLSSRQHQIHHTRSYSPSHSLYEEFEQPLSSPWSQSPAPSPAIKPDPQENPFFAPPQVDEDSFNPTGSSPVYSAQEPVHAIGLESASTVIHIPLIHPSLSKLFPAPQTPGPSNKLRKNSLLRKGKSVLTNDKPTMNGSMSHHLPNERRAPIAILSLLSPVIPYPSNFVHSLTHFAPLVATALSLALAHDSLQTQLLSVNYRRRLPTYPLSSFSPSFRRGSSVTSPSSNSTFSRFSNATSRVASPNTEAVLSQARGTSTDSPGMLTADSGNAIIPQPDSYFMDKKKLLSKDCPPPKKVSKGWYTHDLKCNQVGDVEWELRGEEEESTSSGTTVREKKKDKAMQEEQLKGKVIVPTDNAFELSPPKLVPADRILEEGQGSLETNFANFGTDVSGISMDIGRPSSESGLPKRPRPSQRGKHGRSRVLPSYGADYAVTFNSLSGAGEFNLLKRRHSLAPRSLQMPLMPPPSNRLLRTIIDSIPVHVFTAAPGTGVTTWVNARMLAYRGSTVEEFLKDPWAPYHPEDRAEYRRQWKIVVDAGIPFSHQVRILRYDGFYRWFMIRAVPLRDAKGQIVHWFGTNMDVHDQRVAEINAARQQEMAESEHKYRSLANSSPQIVFACTADDGITFANTQWETYSGQTLEQTLRLGFMEFVHPHDRKKCSLPGLSGAKGRQTVKSPGQEAPTSPDVQSPGARSRERGRQTPRLFEVLGEDGSDGTFSTELRLRRKDNEYRWHLVRCVRVESNFGTGEGQWFGTCTDINDHKLLEQKLKEANDAAQKTMESKTRFLANMSHEIRTPLIGISGMVNFLLDTTLSGEQLDYCHTISQSSEGLLMVINDILDLSKVEAGMMRLNSTWFRIHSLIEDANELLSTMAIQKQLELNYIVEENVPLVVGGDRVRLRQVLLNVIGNAIKFTQTGEVFSRCSVIKEAIVGEDEVMLQFECHDTGPGFDKQEEELIFKPFSQIDGSSTRAHGGSGLGLVISRQLVELHGGTMTARSVKGKGSMFVFSAVFKVPPQREENGTGQENIEDDHILDKGFSETPSITPDSLNYGDSENGDPLEGSSQSFNNFMSKSEKLNVQRLLLPEGDDPSTWLSLPPEITDRVTSYTPVGHMPESPTKQDPSRPTPPAFSILIVSPHPWSLHAISHHIRMTLPKTVPHHMELSSTYDECLGRLNTEREVPLTHVVLNLQEQSEAIDMLRRVRESPKHSFTAILILTNPMLRTAILEGAGVPHKEVQDGGRIIIVNKPIKPARFGVIFDPARERDASMDRNRDSAQQVVESQKRVFTEMEKDVGNKGHRVLLVEDNPVNQKVLLRFLSRVGLEVETASDGEECVSKVFSNGSGHYALILCDLHMPRKDGFQACAEIRQWEKARKLPLVPIIALSANVMSDVEGRCAAAGFSNYVAKPVDFEVLSSAIKELLDPSKTHLLMSQQPRGLAAPPPAGVEPRDL